ncbi:MAG: response regulator transcription factor [Acidobacteria bacterium]|nr:response regulator transcription factor [Acidobacteriota bacterium]MBK8150147.1 response regulator transcription factor [Acidobacteriota bacterium]MBK8810068.1 response regulator transcription factor [Acidobacteriota bacterium]
MTEPIKVIIADDHPIFRSGLKQIIEGERRFSIVAEATDGEAALKHIENEVPDILVLDVNMPKMTGFALAKEIQTRGIGCEIVFLTMHSEEAMFNKAMDLGAKGYVLKESAATDIVNCLQAVANGQNFTSPAVTTYLFKRATRNPRRSGGVDDLTPMERTVLKQIAEYKTSREIADDLCISHRTVENHRYNICQKLGVSGSNALVKFALQNQGNV